MEESSEMPLVSNTTEVGLQRLANEEDIFIYQMYKTFAELCLTEINYLIKNEKNEHLYQLRQSITCCGCFSSICHFEMSDLSENDILQMKIPWSCRPTTMELSTPRGEMLGNIRLQWNWCKLHFRVEDCFGNVLQIKGSKWYTPNCGDVTYKILSEDGAMPIGSMRMVMCCPLVTDGEMERFVINVPVDLDVRMKALIIGAALLIEVMERS